MGGIVDKDILIARVNAHVDYLYPRIVDEEKRSDFYRTIQNLINDEIPLPTSKSGGVEMAIDIFLEILHYHKRRFVDGRHRANFYLEKI